MTVNNPGHNTSNVKRVNMAGSLFFSVQTLAQLLFGISKERVTITMLTVKAP